MSTLTCVRLL